MAGETSGAGYKRLDGKRYTLYQVTNNLPSRKEDRKKYYIVSAETDPDKILHTIRGAHKSKTAKGGAKAMSADMAKMEDYHDKVTIKKLAKGLSKTTAYQLRNRLKDKQPKAKVYNKPKD